MKKNLFKKLLTPVAVFALLLSFCLMTPFSNINKANLNAHASTPEPETSASISTNARNTLSGVPAKLYDYLAEEIKKVASGEENNSRFELHEDDMQAIGAKYVYTNEDFGKQSISSDEIGDPFFAQFELESVVTALLHDMPYELYWFDKTTGYGHQVPSMTGHSKKWTVQLYVIYFHVANEYRGDSYVNVHPTLDTTKTTATASVLENAKAIVETNKALKDYQKLLAYKNKICELVTYNDDATGYGNPWQVPYVFDNNTSTNVVCEGYAKAFQLLCNLSTFESELVKCYTISGTMIGGTGAGGHMWNIVTMDDGFSYIADITNSDTGTVGQDGELFLKGFDTGSFETGYVFTTSPAITFTYDTDTKNLWGTENHSILKISANDYQEDFTEIEATVGTIIYDGEEITVGHENAENVDIFFKLEESVTDPENYSWTIEIYHNNNGSFGDKLTSNPVFAGKYIIKATAVKNDSSDQATAVVSFEIGKKKLEVATVTAISRKFNNSTRVSLSDITFSGKIDGDDVHLITSSVVATISSKDVGEYNKINLSNFILSGEQKDNYTFDEEVNDFSVDTITISKANPITVEQFENVIKEGKTLADLEIEIIGKGIANETISGTFVWVDENGNALELSTEITKDTKYRYYFTPDSLNYNSIYGEVVLWDSAAEDGKLDFVGFAKDHIKEIGIGVGALIVLVVVISVSKKRRHSGAAE